MNIKIYTETDKAVCNIFVGKTSSDCLLDSLAIRQAVRNFLRSLPPSFGE